MKKYFSDMYHAYKTGHLFNYFGIIPPEWLIDVLNFLKKTISGNNERSIRKLVLNVKNSKLIFFIDSKYEHWIVGFFDYLNKYGKYNTNTISFNNEIKILVGDFKTKFDETFDVFIDLADETVINDKYINKKYIKRECLIEDYEKYKLIPLPYLFSKNSDFTESIQKNKKTKKKINKHYLVFGGQIKSKNDNRKSVINELKHKLGNKFYNYGLSFEKHIETLNQTKYALNIFGAGEYCHRFTEIALSDTLIVCQKYHIYIPNDYTDMENIVYFDDIDELISKMKYLDENPKVYDKIKFNFKKHFKKYHSNEKWCDFLLKSILDN